MSTGDERNQRLCDAIVEVLEAIREPLSPVEISEWLTTAGVEAEPEAVEAQLVGDLAKRVRVPRGNGKWCLAVAEFTADQLEIINAASDDRTIVNAGPGAGKTEVAAARVAKLVATGTPASQILIASFTRAATTEIRDRVSRHSEDGSPRDTGGIVISTLDSLAGRLTLASNPGASFTGSYTDTLRKTVRSLRDQDPDLLEFVGNLHHLVIDESQDLVGIRSEFCVALIDALSANCGLTILVDPAQAIYGEWSVVDEDWDEDAPSFVEQVMARSVGKIRVMELASIHRTSDPELLEMGAQLREIVVAKDGIERANVEGMTEIISAASGIAAEGPEEFGGLVTPGADQFFLFRTRGEVAQASSYLSKESIDHRIRYPGLVKPVYPWIGRALFDYPHRRMTRAAFVNQWTLKVQSSRFNEANVDEAWELLYEHSRAERSANSLDLFTLRQLISRPDPPDDLTMPTTGSRGPVLSTIHSSKGREAEEVILVLNESHRGNGNSAEEAKVVYVGATRAREDLSLATNKYRFSYVKDSRRAWRRISGDRQMLEFGLAGDVDPYSPVRTDFHSDPEAVKLQDVFASKLALKILSPVYWAVDRTQGWKKIIRAGESRQQIAICGAPFDHDLWQLAIEQYGERGAPANEQNFLYVIGFTTVACDPESSIVNDLNPTFAKSGFWLSPIIRGFSWTRPRNRARKG